MTTSKKVYSIAEVAKSLCVSRSTAKALIARGTLRAFKIGRRVLVATDELDRFVSEAPSVSATS